MDRGRTLSPNAAVSSQPFTPPGDNTITTQRPKDPVVSYGSPNGQIAIGLWPAQGDRRGQPVFRGIPAMVTVRRRRQFAADRGAVQRAEEYRA